MRMLAVAVIGTTIICLNLVNAQDATNGAKVFISCAKCHGDKAEGNQELKAPKLAGQYDWYIQTQLSAFKSGTRKYKHQATCANGLSEKEIADVATYLKGI